MQYTPYLLPLILTATIAVVVAYSAWRRRMAPGAIPLVFLMLAVVEWSLAYALELSSFDLATKVFWAKVEYLGIVTVPGTWLACILQYTGRERRLTPRNLALLTIEPLVTIMLVWTNDIHGLVWSNLTLDNSSSFSTMLADYGAWFWVHTAYSYLLIVLGTLLTIQSLIRTPQVYRGQATALLIAVFAPWVGNLLYLSRSSPFPRLDLTPFAFTATGIALGWSILRFRFLDIVPVARSAVIESMSDAVIVLDAQNRLVDLNPAAQHLIRM